MKEDTNNSANLMNQLWKTSVGTIYQPQSEQSTGLLLPLVLVGVLLVTAAIMIPISLSIKKGVSKKLIYSNRSHSSFSNYINDKWTKEEQRFIWIHRGNKRNFHP